MDKYIAIDLLKRRLLKYKRGDEFVEATMLAIDALERSLVLGGCSFCDSTIDTFHVLNEGGKYTSGVELAFHHSGMLKVTVFDMVGSAAIEELVRLHVCPVCGKAL